MATSSSRSLRDRLPKLSMELENTGSVARDHLALERTFLAWLRTSLGLVSLGIAIAQLFRLPQLQDDDKHTDYMVDKVVEYLNFQSPGGASMSTDAGLRLLTSTLPKHRNLERLGRPIGATFIGLGALILLLGFLRYFSVQAHLVRGVFPPSRIEISLSAMVVGALIIAAFSVIVGARLGAA